MIVEIPKGTKKKFELNPETFDKVECVRKIKYRYPFYYGCFPKTLAGDNDPTDAILITNKRYKSLDIVKCYPVAVIKTVDWGFIDDKVILLDSAAKLNDRKVSKEIRKIIPKTIAPKIIKYLGIHLIKELKDLYTENYKVI